MNIVQFSSVREEIMSSIKRHMLIPIIGSGFTVGCSSKNGKVPSGRDYRNHMIKKISELPSITENDMKKIETESFSAVSTVYHSETPKDQQLNYLRDHFTCVTVEDYKQEFLSLDWLYIYTLNIDDAIEKNSLYKTVVYSNRAVRNTIFDQNKCVIKLHGDINEMLVYEDSESEVFDKKQYVVSIQKNISLLNRLTHDLSFQNLIYIGISLDDEIDLLSVSENATIGKARYYCTVGEPSFIDSIKLKNYGITHCIVFNDYREIYELIIGAAKEAVAIKSTELDDYKCSSFSRMNASFEDNMPYLFFGKSLVNKDRSIILPSFYIDRNLTRTILSNIENCGVQFVLGNSCSGKTYTAIDVAIHIRDRDVYLFESKDCLNDSAIQHLVNKGNCMIIADNGSLNIQQIEWILRNEKNIIARNVHFIVISNRSNHDLSSLINLLEINNVIIKNSTIQNIISNRFNSAEVRTLNALLIETTLGVFTEKKTIADNIISASRALMKKNKYSDIVPCFSNEKMLACLLALSIEQKVYSYQLVEYNLYNEMLVQAKVAAPLIEKESTWSFETNVSNNSTLKYVINAEYWLNYQLDSFANNQKNLSVIVSAFRYIISQIILAHGKPDIINGIRQSPYKPYILFDNINRIFSTQGLTVAREVYDGINDLLSADPHYMHQRAKCLIKYAKTEKTPDEKYSILEQAYRYASIAHGVFEKRLEECGNDKIHISIDHVKYTMALILCHICRNNDYSILELNTNAVNALYTALSSPYNSYAYAKTDSFNYGNVVYSLIAAVITKKAEVERSSNRYIQELFRIVLADN